jgi:hypothetical protein
LFGLAFHPLCPNGFSCELYEIIAENAIARYSVMLIIAQLEPFNDNCPTYSNPTCNLKFGPDGYLYIDQVMVEVVAIQKNRAQKTLLPILQISYELTCTLMLKNFIPPIYKSILEFRNDEFGVIE